MRPRARVALFVVQVVLTASCVQDVPVLTESPTSRMDGGGAGDAGGDADGGSPDGGMLDGAAPPALGSRLAAGFEHGCVLATDGTLSCWGKNEHGQLGLGDSTTRHEPARLEGRWVSVAAGGNQTCAIDEGQRLHCWGENAGGSLGQGDTEPRSEPTEVTLPATPTMVAVGERHVCAIVEPATLHCWGENSEGQIGQADSFDDPVDTPLPTEVPGRWRYVAAGAAHTCAIDTAARLHCWGRNTESQTGFPEPVQLREPTVVTETPFRRVSAGQLHTCGIDLEDRLWCWGQSEFGMTGHGDQETHETPERPESAARWARIDVNWFQSCAVRFGGSLSCWGWNEEGWLGLGDELLRRTPTVVPLDASVQEVAAGRFFTCLLAGERVACAGRNLDGQLGVGAEPTFSSDFLFQP